ncbi:MAG TPA: oligosaccharide flippase family protein [Burkholderiaceae bacterium]
MTVRKALAYSYAEKYGSYVLGLLSTMVISRLLGPAEIGVFSVGMALVGIVAVIREFGLSTYLVQEVELSDERVRAAFTLAVALGVGLSLVVLVLSVPAGHFYGDPNVTSVIAILALNFALTPFGSISQALLVRELRFSTLTWIRLLVGLIQAVGSVVLAALGLGPQSLAWAAVLASVANSVISIASRPHPMSLIFSGAQLRRVFVVGGPVTAISIIEDVVTSLPELVLGRTQSLTAAGLFSRARGMSQMAHQLLARAAGPVFLAVFADRNREGVPLAPLYLKATACVTTLGWAGLAMLAVLSDPVVRVLFGSNWLAVVPLMRWLCLAAAVALLTSGAHHLLLAGGGMRDVLHAKLLALPAHAIGILVGAVYGARGMAIAMVVTSAFASLLLALAVRRRMGISLRDQLSPVVASAVITVAGAAGSSVALLLAVPDSSVGALAKLAVGVSAGTVLATAVLMTGKHPLRVEVELLIARLRRASP